MNGYNLTRNWFDFKFENVSKVRAIHSEFYFYLIDQWNRLGQKKEFGLPTSYTMECLGIGSYNTYKKVLNDLVEFGFVIIVKDSKNQHSAKIIALSKSDKATDKALGKATAMASDKATDTIDEPINNKPINIDDEEENFFEDVNFEKKEKAKHFLKTAKPSQIDRLRMQHKLSVEHYNEKVDEFVDKKFDWGENSKWKNEDDMAMNFEFWLPLNYKRVVNPYKQWTEEEFKQDCAKHMKTFGKYVLNKFYNHFRQKTPTGEMLFQSRNAWNTEAQLKNWCNENLKKQNNI